MENKRLHSLDALRGFDMLFIMGGNLIVTAIAAAWPCGFTETLANQMRHVRWEGFAFYDTIFPLFLFIAGVSFPFSYAKSTAAGKNRRSVYLDILRRALILVALGVVYNGLFRLDFEHLRLPSVLARIGLGWALAAAIYMNTSTRQRIAVSAAILLGYWALLGLCPAPDAPAGASPFSYEGNLVGYIDRLWLPNGAFFDPEGALSTLPAIVTALLGTMTGDAVRKATDKRTGARTAAALAATGMALALAGWAWGEWFPIIKKLWTSSFVCVAGGISMTLFALFYYIIDVAGARKWAFFFAVIGMNSITIYLAQAMIDFGFTAEYFTGGLAALAPDRFAPLIKAFSYVAACWGFLYILYRRRIFLKV